MIVLGFHERLIIPKWDYSKKIKKRSVASAYPK